jgi:TolB-like protein
MRPAGNALGISVAVNKCLFIALVVSMAVMAQDVKYTIAVSDLKGQGIDEPTAAILSDRLRTDLFKTGKITVLERGVMQDILKEQGFQQTACTSDTCIVQVGQLLGVSHMISGTLGKLEGMYTLDIRMFEVSSGKIVYSESVDCACPIEKVITGSIPAIARKIAMHVANPSADTAQAQVKTEPAPPAPPPPAVPHTGGLSVTSNPPGAAVLLNDSPSGATPFTADKLEAGRYLLRLDLATYKLIDDSVTVTAGQVEKREYTLSHTVTWRDSVTSARRDFLRSTASAKQVVHADKSPKPKKNPALKITLGLLSLASGAAGVYCGFVVKDQIAQNNKLRTEYASLSDNSLYPQYSSKINNNAASARSYQLMQYGGFICAGLCAAGFVLTFAF